MGDVNVIPLVDEGLGNSAYLVDLADGRALAVDASRDLRRLRAAAEKRGLDAGLRRGHAPARRFPDRCGRARGTATARRCWRRRPGIGSIPHTALADGDEVDLGGLTLRTLATPGHTHEHIAFELLGRRPDAGGVHRRLASGGLRRRAPTWSAPEQTEELARAQYRSLQRLAKLDDDVRGLAHPRGGLVLLGAARGRADLDDRASNAPPTRCFAPRSEDVFVKQLLASLGSFPPYFLRLAEINRRGPALVEGDTLAPLQRPRGGTPAGVGCRAWWTCGRSPTSPPATSQARCPSRCGRYSPPGWAGWSPPTGRW